jgi:hypothetical protein
MGGTNEITAGDGSRPEMDRCRKWVAAGDGSRPDWHCGRRWMTGDGSQEMDHGRRMTMNLLPFYEDSQAMRSYTILEITTLNSNYEVSMQRRYACIRCTSGMAPPSTMPSTIPSTIQRCRILQLHARVSMSNTIPNRIPSHSYNADTAQAVQD